MIFGPTPLDEARRRHAARNDSRAPERDLA